MSERTMSERTEAQKYAARSFTHEKRWAKLCRAFTHEQRWAKPYRAFTHELPARFAGMRNAWVAYHAGAPWMNPWRETLQDNARLTAEVERWRVRTDDLRRLVSAKRIEAEQLQVQLTEARAEVERLRRTLRQAACNVRVWGRQSRMSNPHSTPLAKLADRLDTLAREDGAE
jgi:hypothetical protein